MKTIPIKKRVPWPPEHNRQLIDLYNTMLSMELAGKPYKKAPMVRALAEKQGRSKGSVEAKLMNVSAIYENVLNKPRIKGYKPLINFNKSLAVMICKDYGYDYEQ